MKIIALANHKGGVSKTTLSTCLADAFARANLSVLLVDFDPQGHATQLAYSYEETPAVTIEQVLAGSASIASAIVQKSLIVGVDLVGSTLKLGQIERQLQSSPFSSTSLLKNKLAPLAETYDVVVLDTPPSLGFLSANALAAADYVFVPIESGSKLSLIGIDDLLEFIGQARSVNPKLAFGGAILTRHDTRKKMHKLTARVAQDLCGQVLAAYLPGSTDVHKAQAMGQTILQYDRDHTCAKAMVEIAREIAVIAGLTAEVRDGE